MKPIYLSIQQEATGNRIREPLLNNGYRYIILYRMSWYGTKYRKIGCIRDF